MKETLTRMYDLLCFMELNRPYPAQMEILRLAIKSEDWDAANKVLIELKPKTIFLTAIKDTYKRSFDGWKHDYKYITELAIVLNHKCWRHYENKNEEVSKVYSDLYYKVRDWACSHLKGAEFEYYYRITD